MSQTQGASSSTEKPQSGTGAESRAGADSAPRRGSAADARPGLPRPLPLGRRVSWFLLAFGVWSWFLWITFVKNLWADASGLAFDDAGEPTGYFWVHLLLAVTSFLLGTAIGIIGFRGLRALRDRPAE